MKISFLRSSHPLLLLPALFILWEVGLAAERPPLEVVRELDLMRYQGTWYEIARLPNRFQTRCAGEVNARYELKKNGMISVLNSCTQHDGSRTEASGVAKRAAKNKPPSKLKVRFAPALLSFLPQVWGEYSVIELDPDYQWAVVGAENREFFWILARTPHLQDDLYTRLLEKGRQQGFDAGQVKKTRQANR